MNFKAQLLSAQQCAWLKRCSVGLSLVLMACSMPPDEREVDAAVRQFLDQGGNVLGAQLPLGSMPKTIQLGNCTKQESPAGHLCNVTIVTEELPLLGAVSVPLTMRFAKSDLGWQAYLN